MPGNRSPFPPSCCEYRAAAAVLCRRHRSRQPASLSVSQSVGVLGRKAFVARCSSSSACRAFFFFFSFFFCRPLLFAAHPRPRKAFSSHRDFFSVVLINLTVIIRSEYKKKKNVIRTRKVKGKTKKKNGPVRRITVTAAVVSRRCRTAAVNVDADKTASGREQPMRRHGTFAEKKNNRSARASVSS